MDNKQDLLRKIPSVEHVLEQAPVRALGDDLPRWAVADAVRAVLDEIRESISSGKRSQEPDLDEIVNRVEWAARAGARWVVSLLVRCRREYSLPRTTLSCAQRHCTAAMTVVTRRHAVRRFGGRVSCVAKGGHPSATRTAKRLPWQSDRAICGFAGLARRGNATVTGSREHVKRRGDLG